MTWREVFWDNGCFAALDDQGWPQPITVNQQPVREFGGGWRARGIYTGCKDFGVLDLVSDDGSCACWVLDSHWGYLSNGLTAVSPEHADQFAKAVRDDIRVVVNVYLSDPHPGRNSAVRELMALSEPTRIAYYTFYTYSAGIDHDPIPTPEFIELSEIPNDGSLWTAADDSVTSISRQRVENCLAHSPNDWFIDGCSRYVLEWPGLCSDARATDVRSLVNDHLAIYMRCVDPETHPVYFVILWGGQLEPIAVYVPSINRIFGRTAPAGHFYKTGGRGLAWQIVFHLFSYGTAHLDWLNRPVGLFAHFMWPANVAHLGHYLWNELSGVEQITNRLTSDKNPKIFILGGGTAPDFYGPFEDIFPELSGSISRDYTDYRTMIRYCYSQGIQPFRVSGLYVSAAMRDRIMASVTADTEVSHIFDFRRFDEGESIVTFGLRMFDRTHVDQAGFYFSVIERLLQHCDQLTIVIDGLNIKPGQPQHQTFKSYAKATLKRPAIELEQEIVDELRRSCQGLPVRIVNCVGASVPYSLYWISHSQMFIAPWGGGLAKYRWVCNKPGFVISNRLNLALPGHIPIYHDPLCTENPTDLEFVQQDFVFDQRPPGHEIGPDGLDPGMRRGEHVSSANFTLDLDATLNSIERLFIKTKP